MRRSTFNDSLCTDVKTIYSLAYNYFTIGNPYYAGRAELAAFNALPAAVAGDSWSHQYMAEPNQPYWKSLSTTPFWNVNTRGHMAGAELSLVHRQPPQGYSKFTMYSYLKKDNT